MTVFWVLLGIAVLCGVAVVAAGRGDGLSAADPDRPDLVLPESRPAAREDVDRLRFSVGLRGYRMDEVDEVLDRLAADIAVRDFQIGQLQAQVALGEPYAGPHELPAEDPADPGDEQEEVAEAKESAALVPPVEAETDLATARTLLVPLEQFTHDRAPDGGRHGHLQDERPDEDAPDE